MLFLSCDLFDKFPPDEISNLKTSSGATSIFLSWENPDNNDFLDVDIYYYAGTEPELFDGAVNPLGTYIRNLSAETEYTIAIKTVDTRGNVSDGKTVVVTTKEATTGGGASVLDTTPPAEVSNFNGIRSGSEVTLSWTNPTDADFDHVEITYGSPSADTEYTGTINPSGTVVSALNAETDYSFNIKTVDAAGNTSAGVTITVSTLAFPGAVKIVNSWGEGGWENKADGHYWVDFGSILSLQPIVYFYENNFDSAYEPRMIAVFQVDHPYRDEALIEIGVGDPVSPEAVKHFQSDWGYIDWGSVYSGHHGFTDSDGQQITMVMDISELIPDIHGANPENDVFLRISNTGAADGSLTAFSIEYYSDYSQPPFKTISGQTGSFGTGETSFTVNTASALTSAEEFLITPLSRASNFDQPKIVFSYPTIQELEDDMEQYGVYEEGKNYNVISESGFGTGAAPPTLEEWASMKKITDFEQPLIVSASPDSVDNSATVWFPPVGNQGGEGSCTAFAVGYYIHTYNEARENGWDLSGAVWEGGYSGAPSAAYQDRIMSPDFFYHQVNSGGDNGSSHRVIAELAVRLGGASWETMPYDWDDHTSWPGEAAFRYAASHRGRIPETFTGSDISINPAYASCGYFTLDTPEAIELLKEILAAGYCVSTSVNASAGGLYDLLDSEDVVSGYTGGSMSTNHANTIVGYKDGNSWDPANPDG